MEARSVPSTGRVGVLAKELQTVRETMETVNYKLQQMEEENSLLRWQVKTLGGSPLQVMSSAVAKRYFIMSRLPFLMNYGLLSPDVPFVVTDIEYTSCPLHGEEE